MVFFVASGVCLLAWFPFDFSHFPDVLPVSLHPAFDWVTDGLAMFVAVIALLAGRPHTRSCSTSM